MTEFHRNDGSDHPMEEEGALAVHSRDAAGSLSLADVELQGKPISSHSNNNGHNDKDDGGVVDVDLDQGDDGGDLALRVDELLPSNNFANGNQRSSNYNSSDDYVQHENSAYKRRWKATAYGFGCVLILLIVAAVAFATRPLRDNDTSNSSNNRPPNNDNPAQERPSVFQVTQYLIQRQAVASQNVLTQTDSPQFQALEWLAERDSAALQLPPDDDDDMDGYLYVARYVLAVLYYATQGEKWHAQLDFVTDQDICSWRGNNLAYDNAQFIETGGVICDPVSGLPVKVDLEFNSLRGTIPTELGLLTTLQYLDLEFNSMGLTGSLPTELCQLNQLIQLGVRGNELTGGIPTCVGQMPKLQELLVGGNALEGKLPTELCQLSNTLHVLVAARCALTGVLPACFQDMEHLELLVLYDNLLEGNLSPLSQVSTLKTVFLDDNLFHGDPIGVLNTWTQAEELFLDHNAFTGVIGDEFLRDSENLIALDMSHNNFTSTNEFPAHLFRLPNLIVFDLSVNQLQGSIAPALPVNNVTQFFTVHMNQLTGKIPNRLQEMGAMQHLDLSHNQFDGPLPDGLFEMTSLVNLFLAENPNLASGEIPPALSLQTRLQDLSLKNTNRVGPLPDVSDLNQLVLLDLDSNQLTGTVPDHYGSLSSLRYLLLNNNPGLNGTLPETWPDTLRTVFVDGTALQGDMTAIFCDLPLFNDVTEEQRDVNNWMIVADCRHDENDEGLPVCECCHCCRPKEINNEAGGCSELAVSNLDYTWERNGGRAERNFAFNLTGVDGPPEGFSSR